MARRVAIPHDKIALRIAGPNNEWRAHRIQRLDIPTTIPNEIIDELGNPQHAGTVDDIPEVRVTFSAMDVSYSIFAYLTGYTPATFPADGVDISMCKTVDLIAEVRSDAAATVFKSIHVGNAYFESINLSYSVRGNSTEEYTVMATDKRFLRYTAVVETGAGPTLTTVEDALLLRNNRYALGVYVDGIRLADDEFEEAIVGGKLVVTPDTAPVTTMLVIYHTLAATPTWADVSDAGVPPAVKGKYLPVKIGVENIFRVQSVNIRATFPMTPIDEMGNVKRVGYIKQVPDVTGDISVMDTDMDLINLLTTGATGFTTYNDNSIGDFISTLSLEVQICDPAATGTVLKTVYIPRMKITSEGTTANVGDVVTQTFGFRSETAQLVIYSGLKSGSVNELRV